MDEETMKLGLLVETAETTQQLVSALLEKLKQHTQGLDGIVRQEIRRTLLEEMRELHNESQRTVEALRRVQRSANVRVAFWSVGVTAICGALAAGVVWWWLPSATEIAGLREQHAELLANIDLLEQRGARADLRHCGDQRLCVRVDLKAPRYGDHSDYLVIKGY